MDIALNRSWSGAQYAIGVVRGANHPSCEYELAMIRLAASPKDCQARIAAAPTQSGITIRVEVGITLVLLF
jgi:hypothetical protein